MAGHVPECVAVTLEATLVGIGLRKAANSLGENNTECGIDHPGRCIIMLRDKTDISVKTYRRQQWIQLDIWTNGLS